VTKAESEEAQSFFKITVKTELPDRIAELTTERNMADIVGLLKQI
jgi:hypothetical protein